MASNAFETLGLPPTATADEVKAQWKSLASQHHPDKGGDAETFDKMRRAYKSALEIASKPKKCPACDGTGKRRESHGFNSIEIQCRFCKGSGVRS